MAASLRLFVNGLTAGTPGFPNHDAKRGPITGWSTGAARRHRVWLYSVDTEAIQREGYHGLAFTLTVALCPDSPQEWARTINRFLVETRRTLGWTLLHWCVEWQARKVPHLHGCMFFPLEQAADAEQVKFAWCKSLKLGAIPIAQSVKPINGLAGWLKYLAKHVDRGVRHYQRSNAAIPPSWRGFTGRLWGHRGDWPVPEPERFQLHGAEGDGASFAFRRLVRGWRVADARRSGDRKRIAAARRMLKCSDRRRSEVRGVSEWAPSAISRRLLDNLLQRGYAICLPPPPAPSLG